MKLVYVVEDDHDLLNIEVKVLEASGYIVRGFTDTISLCNGLEALTPDLILLDLTLPDRDGLEACRDLKLDPVLRAIPVIMVTGRQELDDIVKGLDLGADDYICKPFEQEELLARVRAILRRSAHFPQTGTVEIAPGLNLDTQRQELIDEGRRIILTLSEFRILQLLINRPEWAFRRSEILDHLWGDDKIVVERTVDVHISNLREKLGSHSTLIQKVHGVGYRFKSRKENNE
ncbi:MAG: response regulator transcription factor [Candidatus Syntrophosphaera sp.]|jgi:two-component system phosphate regulon response regulator PhoB/two-component system alkaline phosphatase synthesis response regulator PhoP|nr:response regulator transcription factor [Candidatus Cloacimonadota bacterium]MDX9949787.1 response regulator transcription factor [Candidatus Syntrophosphaera sp.]